jgi:hypothetical protein
LTTSGSAVKVVADKEIESVGVFCVETVKVPGPFPARAMLQMADASSEEPQLEVAVYPLVVTVRPLAGAEPGLRTVRFGRSSLEIVRNPDVAAVETCTSNPAVPEQRLLVPQAEVLGKVSWSALGSKLVGAVSENSNV